MGKSKFPTDPDWESSWTRTWLTNIASRERISSRERMESGAVPVGTRIRLSTWPGAGRAARSAGGRAHSGRGLRHGTTDQRDRAGGGSGVGHRQLRRHDRAGTKELSANRIPAVRNYGVAVPQ